MLHKGLAIVPAHNLIHNIGYGPEATGRKTKNQNDPKARHYAEEMSIEPLVHPPSRTTIDRYVNAWHH